MSLLDGKQAAPEQKPEPNGPIVHMGRPVQLVIDVLVDPSFVPLLYSLLSQACMQACISHLYVSSARQSLSGHSAL